MFNSRLQICPTSFECYEFLRTNPVEGNSYSLPGKWLSQSQLQHEIKHIASSLGSMSGSAGKVYSWLSPPPFHRKSNDDLIWAACQQSWGVYKYTGINAHRVLDDYIGVMALARSIIELWNQAWDSNPHGQHDWEGRGFLEPETDDQRDILVRVQALLRFCAAHPEVGPNPTVWIVNNLPESIFRAARHETVAPPSGYSSWSAWETQMQLHILGGLTAFAGVTVGVIGVVRIGVTFALANPYGANQAGMIAGEVLAGDAIGGASLVSAAVVASKTSDVVDSLSDIESLVKQAHDVPDGTFDLSKVDALRIRDARRLGGKNRGLIFVHEPQGDFSELYVKFESGTLGALSDIPSQQKVVPAIRFDNPNPRGYNFAKFDGIEADGVTLIDRKTSLTTKSKQLQSLQRVSIALKQNPDFKLVFEFPNQKAADRALDILIKQNITNINIRVAQ